jgi:hypothetical protein
MAAVNAAFALNLLMLRIKGNFFPRYKKTNTVPNPIRHKNQDKSFLKC